MAENATSHDEQQRGNINSISVLTFGRVRDVIESSLVLLVGKRCTNRRYCAATCGDAHSHPWNAATALENSCYSAAAADGTVTCPTGSSSSRGSSRALVLSQ